MPYVHQVSFELAPERASELQTGAPLQRVIGYLRALLPDEAGYVTSRAMVSLDNADRTRVVFQSVWEDWDDLMSHRSSEVMEEKTLTEFGHLVAENAITSQSFAEVA
ncbi:MAG: hypothetical protein ACOH2M_20200 [Cypionkella sp.]